MDFKDIIRQLGIRVNNNKEQTTTEEATKMAFIAPFIQALGYDVFNPSEVKPEFDADIPGLKKGEKVDYAVFIDGTPKILIECKHWKQNLDLHDGQLVRYFHVTQSKFALLTNGIVYKFYTDLFEPNKMDSKPFLEFDITRITDPQIEELKKFHKSYFDEANITSAANELIYTNEIKLLLATELKSPSEEFVKYFAQKAYQGKVTQRILTQFTDLVKRSSNQVINEIINERLTSAMKQENEGSQEIIGQAPQSSNETEQDDKNNIVTTAEELEAFYIVKSILRTKIDANRIVHRDGQVYFSILLDDNNRKPICRLHLNRSKKYLETFSQKAGTKNEIASLDDIFKYSSHLHKTVEEYEVN